MDETNALIISAFRKFLWIECRRLRHFNKLAPPGVALILSVPLVMFSSAYT